MQREQSSISACHFWFQALSNRIIDKVKVRKLSECVDSGRQQLSRFVEDTSGGVLVIVGLMTLVLGGFAAMALDVGQWYSGKRGMQTAADAAALHAAYQLAAGDTDSDIILAAKDDADLNGFGEDDGAQITVTVGTGQVEVLVTQPATTLFAGLVQSGETTIAARAVAAFPGNPVCIQALDPGEKEAFKVNSGTVFADDCSVQVNSDDGDALKVFGGGGGVLDSADTNVVGGYSGGGLMTPTPETGQPYVNDPLADLPAPTVGDCNFHNVEYDSGTHTLTEGVYCGGIFASSTAHLDFEPGLYIIAPGVEPVDGALRGGKLQSTGTGSQLTGAGVTFFFSEDSRLSLAGQGDIDLSAPTSGTYAGILFFGDPNAPTDLKHSVSGNGTLNFDGTMYFPTAELTIIGNGDAGNEYNLSTVIARLLKFGGNAALNFDGGGNAAALAGRPSLVE